MASSDPAVVSRAWRTVAEMVADRGIDASMARGVGDDEILALADDNTTFAVPIAPGLSAVFHWGGQAVKKQDIFALTGDAKHVILVAASLSAATTKALAAEAALQGVDMEVFSMQDMQFNVTRHSLVPRHERVPPAEDAALLKTLNVTSRFQLPVILNTDPVARYLNLSHGELVRVHRASPTSGTTVAYRCCYHVS
jgi:DNA-directed RNA polymerase subunit H (RpoH/RPB5)